MKEDIQPLCLQTVWMHSFQLTGWAVTSCPHFLVKNGGRETSQTYSEPAEIYVCAYMQVCDDMGPDSIGSDGVSHCTGFFLWSCYAIFLQMATHSKMKLYGIGVISIGNCSWPKSPPSLNFIFFLNKNRKYFAEECFLFFSLICLFETQYNRSFILVGGRLALTQCKQ